jgi:hypothetical protein
VCALVENGGQPFNCVFDVVFVMPVMNDAGMLSLLLLMLSKDMCISPSFLFTYNFCV